MLIFVLCTVRAERLPSFDLRLLISTDKLGHFVFYAVFSLLIIYGHYRQHQGQWMLRAASRLAFYISVPYGMLMELLQAFVFFGRSAEWLDILANCIGSMVGVFIFYACYRLRYGRR